MEVGKLRLISPHRLARVAHALSHFHPDLGWRAVIPGEHFWRVAVPVEDLVWNLLRTKGAFVDRCTHYQLVDCLEHRRRCYFADFWSSLGAPGKVLLLAAARAISLDPGGAVLSLSRRRSRDSLLEASSRTVVQAGWLRHGMEYPIPISQKLRHL